MHDASILQQRIQTPRAQQRQTTVEMHRLHLAFPSRGEVVGAACRDWQAFTGLRLQPDPAERRVWLGPGDTGLIIAIDNFGAFSGDGVDMHVHFVVPGDCHATFCFGMDHSQRDIPVLADGPEEADLAPLLRALTSLAFRLRRKPQP